MRVLVLVGLMALSACGGGGTTGTNYAEAPPMAEIVATPTPKATTAPEVANEAQAADPETPANDAEPAVNEAAPAD